MFEYKHTELPSYKKNSPWYNLKSSRGYTNICGSYVTFKKFWKLEMIILLFSKNAVNGQ